MNSTDRDYDDLTLIPGIANKRQQFLRQSLNVRTFLDFANRPIAEIEAVFKAEGQIISRNTIEQWQREARRLATAVNSLTPPPLELPDEADSGSDDPPAATEQWIQFASFVVAFETRKIDDQEEKRTTVHYVEQDTGETWQGPSWSGIVSEQPCLWMVEQLSEKTQLEPEKAQPVQKSPSEAPPAEPLSIEPSPVEASFPEPVPTETPQIKVEITQIRAFQPPDVAIPSGIGEVNQSFVGLLKGSEPFALEVTFRLPEPVITDLVTRETTYLANFYVRKRATRVTISVGDTEADRLTPEKVSYTARLPEVILQPGTYLLGVLVKLRTRPPSINYLEVPLLQVIG